MVRNGDGLSWHMGLLLLALGAIAMVVFRDALGLLSATDGDEGGGSLRSAGRDLREMQARLLHVETLLHQLNNRSEASAVSPPASGHSVLEQRVDELLERLQGTDAGESRLNDFATQAEGTLKQLQSAMAGVPASAASSGTAESPKQPESGKSQRKPRSQRSSGVLTAYFMNAADIAMYRKMGRYDKGKHAYYGAEFERMCHSLKKYSPTVKISVVTDSPDHVQQINCPAGQIEHVIVNKIPLAGVEWGEKLNALLQSPYDDTVFLDVDTVVCSDMGHMFDFLEAYDMAMVPEPWQVKGDSGVAMMVSKDQSFLVDEHFMMNTGVMAYRNTDKIKVAFHDMLANHPKIGGDQRLYQLFGGIKPSLGWKEDIRILQLPVEFNVRVYGSEAPRLLDGEVKVMHGKIATNVTCEMLNARKSFRLWSSKLGIWEIPLAAPGVKTAWDHVPKAPPLAGVEHSGPARVPGDPCKETEPPVSWIGSDHGGYLVPQQLDFLKSDDHLIVYLVGCGYDISTDLELASWLKQLDSGLEIHEFDPTPGPFKHVQAVHDRMREELKLVSVAAADATRVDVRSRAAQDAANSRPRNLQRSMNMWRASVGPPAEAFKAHPWAIGAVDDDMAAFYLPPDTTGQQSSRTLLPVGDPAQAIQVPAMTVKAVMETLSHSHVDVLKLDLEGGEVETLQWLIRQQDLRPKLLLVEMDSLQPKHPGENYSGATALQSLTQIGYKLLLDAAASSVHKGGPERSFVYCPGASVAYEPSAASGAW